LKKFERKKKKSFGFGKKNFGSDTDTFGFGRYRIPIPKFGRTLSGSQSNCHFVITCAAYGTESLGFVWKEMLEFGQLAYLLFFVLALTSGVPYSLAKSRECKFSKKKRKKKV
jgi:hypothetical protein